MTADGIVFLLDVDNTLLDNDRLKQDLDTQLRQHIGPERTERFWSVYEEVRHEQDYVDYPTTVKRVTQSDPSLAQPLQDMLAAIDFKAYLYPHALEVIAHLASIGTPVILSDGDSVFQPRKIRESGIEGAVEGRVLIYVHKEQNLPEVFARYPASLYVVVDDKPRILSALEECCPGEFTTILVLQGKYAADGQSFSPPPDLVVDSIGALLDFTREQFVEPARKAGVRV